MTHPTRLPRIVWLKRLASRRMLRSAMALMSMGTHWYASQGQKRVVPAAWSHLRPNTAFAPEYRDPGLRRRGRQSDRARGDRAQPRDLELRPGVAVDPRNLSVLRVRPRLPRAPRRGSPVPAVRPFARPGRKGRRKPASNPQLAGNLLRGTAQIGWNNLF